MDITEDTQKPHTPDIMRFDETRILLPSVSSSGSTLKLVRSSGNITLDFIEAELVSDPLETPSTVGEQVVVPYTAV